MKDIIETQFTEADRTEIEEKITELENLIRGKTGVLTKEERQRYGSINEQNKLIVNKTREYRESQPELSATTVDWVKFETDYVSRGFLENCINRFNAMVYSLESTKMMHDYDNYQDSLKDKRYSEFQEQSGEDGYSAKVAEYKQFFTKSKDDSPEEGDEGDDTQI